MSRIYFDNAATTPIDPRVADVMTDTIRNEFGNPSSIHAIGRKSRTLIEQARKTVAQHLNASIGEIFFTSGGTEANNMALKCAVRDLGVTRIISSPTEHHCGLHTFDRLKKTHNVTIDNVKLKDCGTPDMENLEALLQDTSQKTLVSLMHSNNELGCMIDLKVVGDMCKEYGALFHTDTVQTMGFFPIDVDELNISFLSGAAHKFYGPKGVGFIYINSDNIIEPYVDGGAQERNMRAGTENIYGILGMAKALDLAVEEREERATKIHALRAYLLEQLPLHFDDYSINGNLEHCHYKVMNIGFPASVKTDMLLFNLDIAGICISGGSACSSGSDTGSHVIKALPTNASERANIRVSFSHHNTKEELDALIAALKNSL